MATIRPISHELAAKARDELNEVETRIPEDIIALRTWIEKQPYLSARTDDQFLLTFLRGSKYSIEKAKQKIDYYYTVKSISPEAFLDRTIDDKVLRLAKLGFTVPLPKPLKADGPRLHITRYGHIDLNEFQTIDLFKFQLRMLDIEIHEDDNSIISGFTNVVDMSNISLGFVLHFDPVLMKKFEVYVEKAVPIRFKGIHVINAPKELVSVINFTRNLMGKKQQDRMHLHSSLESLYEHVPKENLPEEYGGENGKLQDAIDQWEQRLLNYKEFFIEDAQYKTDEKLRIGSKVVSDSLFGLDGSFRKLGVD